MSDLLIRGMEMPIDGFITVTITSDGRVVGNSKKENGKFEYLDNEDIAKAVPVPSHGRLIDASESIRVEFYDEEHEDWTRHDMTIDDLLSQSWVDADAPTIIPAEPCNNLSKPCKEEGE